MTTLTQAHRRRSIVLTHAHRIFASPSLASQSRRDSTAVTASQVQMGQLPQLLLHHRHSLDSFPRCYCITGTGETASPAATSPQVQLGQIPQMLLHQRYNWDSFPSCYCITGKDGTASPAFTASQVKMGQLPLDVTASQVQLGQLPSL